MLKQDDIFYCKGIQFSLYLLMKDLLYINYSVWTVINKKIQFHNTHKADRFKILLHIISIKAGYSL